MSINILKDERKRMTVKEHAEAERKSLTHLLKAKDLTLEQKQELVKERNPFLYVFGEKLVAQGDKDYATYINHLYLGE
jgi:hypothetical protein